MKKEIVLSGMRPTGASLHLGNYFGALVNFIKLQEDSEKQCFFFIANWHAHTTLPEPSTIYDNVLNVAADYIAAGLDPEKSVIYVQSMVPETAEIALLLSNCISFGRLTNCTTFKDKSSKQEFVTAGLAYYPVLMAADILGVKANYVPVGEDQTQHLEMAREIARHFNKTFSQVFPEPENFVINPIRVPGLDGSNKMGKSDNNTIPLDDTAEAIWGKISVAVTDVNRVKKNDPGNPMLCKIYEIAEIMDTEGYNFDISLEDLGSCCREATHGCFDCKKIINKTITDMIVPISDKKRELLADKDKIKEILREGSKKAQNQISLTLQEMREALHSNF